MPSAIKPGDKIKITINNAYYSRQSYISFVDALLEDNVLLIHLPLHKSRNIRLPIRDDYRFLFYTQHELIQASGKIISYDKQANVELIKIEIYDLISIQRRHYFRLKCLMNFTFKRDEDALKDKKTSPSETEEDPYKGEGLIKNISAGGLCFESNTVLEPEERITCELRLNNDEKMTVRGEIKNIEILQDLAYKYEYRIEYTLIGKEEREKIIKYVFYMERQMIKEKEEKEEMTRK